MEVFFQTVSFIFRQPQRLARSAKMVTMADNNGKENKASSGFSAQEDRGRRIPRLDSQYRPSKLPRQIHPSHHKKVKK
jgi:hypothetical protein